MLRIALFFYSLIASTLAGVGAVAALVAGYTSMFAILAAAAFGALIAVPIAWLVGRHLAGETRPR